MGLNDWMQVEGFGECQNGVVQSYDGMREWCDDMMDKDDVRIECDESSVLINNDKYICGGLTIRKEQLPMLMLTLKQLQ